MKKVLISAAVAAACSAPLAVLAQAAPAKAEPEFTIAGNAGLFSDYRFRGYSQTDYNPAFQGGIDFAHKSGFYLGNWNSNVNSTLYNGASLEMDFYGGYKATFGEFGLDVGTIYYYYPGTGKYVPDFDAKNWEVYVGGSYGPVSLKYYYSFTDFFGLKAPGIDTKGSQYLDLTGTFDLGSGVGLVGHVGWQKIKRGRDIGLIDDSVLDYKVGVTYDIAGSGWIGGLSVIGTSESDLFLESDLSDGAGKTRVVLSVTKSF
ncbi:MAG: TorF family putative porin [Betaproteobacteria bacterium]